MRVEDERELKELLLYTETLEVNHPLLPQLSMPVVRKQWYLN
jgi:hypothetical protein